MRPQDRLTDAELRTLRVLAGGWSHAEAAARLGIREQTVKNHLSNVYLKLGVHNIRHAFAVLGWLVPR